MSPLGELCTPKCISSTHMEMELLPGMTESLRTFKAHLDTLRGLRRWLSQYVYEDLGLAIQNLVYKGHAGDVSITLVLGAVVGKVRQEDVLGVWSSCH